MHGSVAAAARATGACRNTIKTCIARGVPVPAPDKPVVDRARLLADDKARRLESELRSVHRENITAEEVRAAIFRLAETPAQPPEWLVRVSQLGKSALVPCTIWSDWHIGEVVTASEVNGVNRYDLATAEARIRKLVDRTIDLCFRHMTNPEYPGIVVNLLGDIVSGDIHVELSETNETELFPIILWSRDRLIWALKTLADHFGRVFVPCAPGNHGRMTRKPQAKRYVFKNADWLLYCLLERHFQDVGDTRVQFMVPDTGECLYRVFGHRYLGIHGDDLGVRGGDGIIGILGPVARGEVKMHGSQAHVGRDYDTVLMGHWHQLLWLQRAIVNNTLKGYDEYARRFLRATASPPSQALWFNHAQRGITARWEVHVEDAPARTTGSWVAWESAA